MRILTSLRQAWRARQARRRPSLFDLPLRGELFTVEQLTRHAKSLAQNHQSSTAGSTNSLLARLDENEEILRDFNRVASEEDASQRITPAEEWLLDNFYLIEEQIQLARRHLPYNYSRELPRLLRGPYAGFPRVYGLVLELISHADAQIDTDSLKAFIASYQTVSPLKLGELWAVPIMLRLGLIENLQRITTRLTLARQDRSLAAFWIKRSQEMVETDPSRLVVVVAGMADADLPMSSSFVAEFCQQLARHSPVLHLARNWIEQHLAQQGLSSEQLIHLETQNQAADQVSVSHSISSLRLLSAIDWKEFVEALSAVEERLRADPAGVYHRMDFSTRDRYRHAVEALAKYSQHTEDEVAQCAVQLAQDNTRQKGHHHRASHVGFYLVDKGLPRLERIFHVRWPIQRRVERAILRAPLAFYLGGISLVSLLATVSFFQQARLRGVGGVTLAFLSFLFLVGSTQLGVSLINWLSTLLIRPHLLPRLDYSQGIPEESRTMVVVPTMLTSPESIDRLLESLEVHYLANRDEHLHFALLTDFRDAPQEKMPEDKALLERVRFGVEALNRKYPSSRQTIFFLFHRPRQWNSGENLWMGYERKRGKLAQLNAFLRGGSRQGFSEIVGDTAVLSSVKYVITLDTDTQLPRDAARQLVGTMAHRLNRPEFDEGRRIVTEGYSILQPRVGVSLPSSRRSWFVRLFAGDAGVDPYTREVSDVYQDLFQEGSFIGKGIYDVDAFEKALEGCCPENAILSHDLLESCYARSALLSDIELYEDYPWRHNVEAERRHRWIRGDWQIVPWLFPRVPGKATPQRTPNPLSWLSRWKIFDNLRRSLVPISLLLFLLLGWLLAPELGGVGPLFVLLLLAMMGVLSPLVEIVRKPFDLPWLMHLRNVASSTGKHLAQIFLGILFLPYEAFLCADAIGRTLWRMLTTRKRLLEWRTSSEVEQSKSSDLGDFYRAMWLAPLVGVLALLFLGAGQSAQLITASPLLGLWIVSPWVSWRLSRPIKPSSPALRPEQLEFLRRAARKTWHFFETFVSEQEHWLPPDNFQESPGPTIAPRTSPTTIGMALLSNLAARDLGYLSMEGLLQRTQKTLTTMQRLERYRGHLYNWYDTRSLRPLLPLYISSVDSGNLAGHLLTLSSGLRELADEEIYSPQLFSGLADALGILRELSSDAKLEEIQEKLSTPPAGLHAALRLLEELRDDTSQFDTQTEGTEEARRWAQTFTQSCEEHHKDLLFLAPWLGLTAPSSLTSGQRSLFASVAGQLKERLAQLDQAPTLREIAAFEQTLCPSIESLRELSSELIEPQEEEFLRELLRCLREAADNARQRMLQLESAAKQSEEMAAMDFTFLFDRVRSLFSIGYNVTERRCDNSYYDLLASEARLCSYVAISLGQVPQEHWFSIGRLLVPSQGEPILVSWSGSMFEYLMALLVMPNYDNTLLSHTCHAAVRHQIEYGKAHGVPWGVSESGYYRLDAHLNYQYRAFGVPGLGLKRGLAEDLVIAPYATALALINMPKEACENLERLAQEGRSGAYGFYEAIDYTASRLPSEETSMTVKSFMAHHQGMSLLALTHFLRGAPMQRRFLACPLLKATDLLLQERVPRTAVSVIAEEATTPENLRVFTNEREGEMRVFTNPSSPLPEVHLLSNGRYHVALTSAGGGYSRWGDLAVTRWREDATSDSWGTFIYLRDIDSGELWSVAYQPTLHSTKAYEAIFTQGRAEFRQRKVGLEIHTEICVSPEDNVELRRITITNDSRLARVIELTSYAEVVLAPAAADAAHPAFSNLFVQTEFLPGSSALLCTRRARAQDEKPPWLLHMMLSQGGSPSELSCETDRLRFIGRGQSLSNPAVMQSIGPLSNTVGAVLDPIVSLRRVVYLPPRGAVSVDLVLGVAESHDVALGYLDKYQSPRMADRAFDLAGTHSHAMLRHLNASEVDAQFYGRLAGALLYADPVRRANASVLSSNRRGQSGLWSYGISGDAPIVLLRISDAEKLDLVRETVQAHTYWRMKGLTVDLVILIEDTSIYRQSLFEQIISLIASGIEAQMIDKPGGIFLRRLEQIPNEDRILLQATARILLDDERGAFAEQLERRSLPEPIIPALVRTHSPWEEPPTPLSTQPRLFSNGIGGFSPDGREYIITLQENQTTPAPWVNVIANPLFGTIVSESGAGYTWSENAHELRLTPWSNDPIQDPPGEALYLRDEQTGQFWSPTPLPARGEGPYVIRHGFGYTVFEHIEHGISSELWVYVAMDAPVKCVVLKLRNLSGRPRRISVTSYVEWVLSDLRQKSLLHVQTEIDPKTGALFARNYYNTEFADRVAFLDVSDPARTLTGDRREFLGRNGSVARPAALKRMRLSGRVGAGLDPCGAMQLTFNLAEGQEREASFRLGVGRGTTETQNLVRRFRRADASRLALEGVLAYWGKTLGAVQVETPDPSVNVMANGWLLYQTLSSRLWGRTGFYQSGGAYGFRDQLQDTMALVHAEPALTREQLLRAAARQFREGDVQHWWHPPSGRGVRTHFSDDFLWLPYVVCRYVSCLADTGVLQETIPFLEARPVKPEEESYYDLPNRAEEVGTLYEHCVRAIERGLAFGEHGLPLIGCGDWNDGMNRVGIHGKGESVWLAFFLYDVLTQFSKIAELQQDEPFARRCLAEAKKLKENIEAHAWDGQWYRRAYFDSGEPLGSHHNQECQIDSIPQSWSILSGAADPERARQAMASVEERLVRREAKLIQLFHPPFDRSSQNPGYIKGYIPGVRENGGQYTHGAIWAAMAFALMGEHERAWELFALLNPVHHAQTPQQLDTYRVEPYVIAADVYAVPPHTGRGGWTWYTGSAGWMYRLLIETLLGVHLEGDRLRLSPRLPGLWTSYQIHYRYRQTTYHITISKLAHDASQERSLFVDGQEIFSEAIPLQDDRVEHHVVLKVRK